MTSRPGRGAAAVSCGQVRVREGYPGRGVGVLSVAGEIDLADTEQLRGWAIAMVGRRRHVVLDLADVSFLGSSGLSVLVGAHQAADTRGGQLRIVSGPGNRWVTRPIAVSGLDRYLRVHPTVEDALHAFPPAATTTSTTRTVTSGAN